LKKNLPPVTGLLYHIDLWLQEKVLPLGVCVISILQEFGELKIGILEALKSG
jgi:hypothetical protein